ncbi:MAG: UbiA family prenyltransferase [Aureispira sp.]
MNTIRWSIWQLVRGVNLLLLGISLSLIILKAGVSLTVYQWLVLLVGVGSITAAGNIVNDILDQDIDQVNKTDKRIVGVLIKARTAWYAYLLLNSLALLLVTRTGNWVWCSCYLFSIILLYIYSRFLKCKAWWGNILVAFLCALSLLQLLLINSTQWNLYWKMGVIVYASFAFLTNWLRELIKDIEDELGDRQNACQTLPVQQGRAYALKIAHYLCNTLLLWLVLIIMFLWQYAPLGAWIYGLGLVFPTTLYLKMQLPQLKTRSQIHQFSQLLKGYMLLGLIGVLLL